MSLKFIHKDTTYNIGETVKVQYKIKEKDKERLQAFDGIIMAITGKGDNLTFLVSKKATDGITVERIFPVNSPWIDSIKKVRSPKRKVRRSKLYFLRNERARSL